MHGETLKLLNFRNIYQASVSLGPCINLFVGQNGAGKSSVLEAVYLLSYGRSFRSSQLGRMIQHGHSQMTVFIEGQHEQSELQLGYQRDSQGKQSISVNGERQTRLSALSALIPSQLLTTTSYRYFTDGPQLRRNYLNWGTFYQQPSFKSHWQRYQKALKQRNAAIKARLPLNQIQAWDKDLIESAEALHALRVDYVAKLQPMLQSQLDILLDGFSLKLRYESGWDVSMSFEMCLQQELHASLQTGYTLSGPHRADCQLFLDDVPAHLVLSQGQQKLAIYALCFAQGVLLTEQTGVKPIFLIDDLVSELDTDKIGCLARVIAQLNAQTLITGIHQYLFEPIIAAMPSVIHHVNQGTISDAQPISA